MLVDSEYMTVGFERGGALLNPTTKWFERRAGNEAIIRRGRELG